MFPTLSSSPPYSKNLSDLRHLPLTLSRNSSTSLSLNQLGASASSRDSTPDPNSIADELTTISSSSALSNPSLVHRWTNENSIVCVAVSPKKKLLFCGTQDSKILVYDLATFQKKKEIMAHTGSVLCLLVSNCEETLFSGGSDSLVKIWNIGSTNRFEESTPDDYIEEEEEEIYETHTIYSLLDIGDIFSIAWAENTKTVFIGAQNASISYVHLDISIEKADPSSMPSNRFDRFFDSRGYGQKIHSSQEKWDAFSKSRLIEVPSKNIISYAHNGYVYAMESFSNTNGHVVIGGSNSEEFKEILISGGGDGSANIWGVNKNEIKLLHKLDNDDSVLSITKNKNDSFLYCGLTDGGVKVWDLATLQLIRSYASDEGDIVSIALYNDCLFKGTNAGATKWKYRGEVKSDWIAHDGDCLAVKVMEMDEIPYLITTGIDHSVALWNIETLSKKVVTRHQDNFDLTSTDRMLEVLSKIVSYKTVSKQPEVYIDESRQCANFLRFLCKTLGALKSILLPVKDANPVVFATFQANEPTSGGRPSRILWYGHYDVIEVDNSDSWQTDPFKLTALNGYLYARGVTDNKGPLLAAIYAVAELYQQQELESDVIFLIEGEEESGSFGFQDVVTKNQDIIGEIDWVLLSNSYWLDDNIPCLNYGLRGVISATVEVWSDKPDRHSGVDGGISREPTIDLISLLSKLNDDEGNVRLPNFYSAIKPPKEAEIDLYNQITKKIDSLKIADLMSKWRLPSLTIHRVNVSGPGNSTVIPQVATASLSIRIVPKQDINEVKTSLIEYLNSSFQKLKTENHLEVKIIHEAEPWLGDVNNAAYKILTEIMQEEWGVEPILIREGGSIPSIRFLEKIFTCEAAHLPTGQSSDNAHLNNERLRVTNLFKTKEILKKTFNKLPNKNQI
ncbi:hypothetical protein CANARDRAFT_28822 [[Candida] arabinofermentans NRRL YB-2248]|uniref:Peptidase M20 dimerisation domain-containing protein n=1 Tax=[Candida] arabinofermentans NRRL YB-2248 TaxID=983967 RepID=A0A1E4SYX1_9ASCO|nr:hypothetical protein CANARDRAFT_28822 [[Candida] arabinofermentans NRRL YB-2248]